MAMIEPVIAQLLGDFGVQSITSVVSIFIAIAIVWYYIGTRVLKLEQSVSVLSSSVESLSANVKELKAENERDIQQMRDEIRNNNSLLNRIAGKLGVE